MVVLVVLIYRRTGGRRETYQLSQPWTQEPILWSATDEVVPAGRHGSRGHAGHGDSVTVGGGASGHW